MTHAGPVEPVHADPLQQQADHFLRHFEVGDRTLAQGPHRDDVARRAADHLPRLVAHRQHFLVAAVEGDDRRLVEHDALTLGVHEGVRSAEVDREVAGHGSAPRPVLVVAWRTRSITSRRASGERASMCLRSLTTPGSLRGPRRESIATSATTMTTATPMMTPIMRTRFQRTRKMTGTKWTAAPDRGNLGRGDQLVGTGAPIGTVGPDFVLPDGGTRLECVDRGSGRPRRPAAGAGR